MELNRALSQIAAIREQIARAELFRGYRSAATAATAGIAVATAAAQSVLIGDAELRLTFFLYPWFAAAVLSIGLIGVGIARRYVACEDRVQRELTATAIGQFAPYIVIGLLLTVVLVDVVGRSTWLLPGLYMILTGLGIHASRAVLPASVTIVSIFYLMAGLVTLAAGPTKAFEPWTMGGVFGVGQLLAAAVLWRQERLADRYARAATGGDDGT